MATAIDRLRDLSYPTGQEEKLSVHYPRVHIPLKQAGVIVLIILLALAAWWLLKPSPTPTPTITEPQEIVVSVMGAVDKPGLLTLPADSRVADALAQAGVQPEANLIALNQAQVLVDGQQIVVPGPEEESTGISLNTASVAELMALDGVGEKTAAAIIQHREEIGGFSSVEQLLDVSGIGPAKFEAIRDHVSL